MTNKVGGQGTPKGPEAGEVACDPLSPEQLKAVGVESPTGDGATAAARTARPKSVDVKGLTLQDQLDAKLADTSGAADAQDVKKALPGHDAYKINDALVPKLKVLVTVPQMGGIVPKTDATASEIGRFKAMLNTLEKDGKLEELAGCLSAPQPPIGTTNRIMKALIEKHGTPSQLAAWQKGGA